MRTVGGRHVEAAVDAMRRALEPVIDRDWRAPAGSLDWTCWQTAAHLAHDLAAYASQVAGRARAAYLPVDLVVRPSATPAEILDAVTAAGGLLRLAVDHAGRGPVAWHWGAVDASGFAAMGVAELLVHTTDLARGLEVTWAPPDELAALVVARLLPDVPPGPAAETLLWATGRLDIAGRPHVDDWAWHPAR